MPHRIVKPVGLSRGRGISIVRSVREAVDAAEDEPIVVQRYITNPMLIKVCWLRAVPHTPQPMRCTMHPTTHALYHATHNPCAVPRTQQPMRCTTHPTAHA
eukprot:52172-Chlamydomonas_euryale.AAC.2